MSLLKPTPSELLREAAALIDKADALLDMSSNDCEHCGSHRFKNFLHAKVHQSITEMPDKLVGLAARLESQNPS